MQYMDEIKTPHDWLVAVVEHNQAQGIDLSTVEFDAAGGPVPHAFRPRLTVPGRRPSSPRWRR
jgi:hypothetical protein